MILTTSTHARRSVNRFPIVRECHRTGSLMVEVIVASILLAALTAVFVPAMLAIQKQRVAQRDDALILMELNNVAQKTSLMPVDDVRLSGWFQARFPDAELQIRPMVTKLEFSPEDQSSEGVSDTVPGVRIQITASTDASRLKRTSTVVTWPTPTSGADEQKAIGNQTSKDVQGDVNRSTEKQP